MEPKVSALSLTILSVFIVFVVLWGLAVMINLIKVFTAREQKKESQVSDIPTEVVPEIIESPSDAGVSPKTVAAISAALAAYLDQDVNQLMISAIYRLAPGGDWAAAGRLENTSSGSLLRRSV